LELVEDRETKAPFDPRLLVHARVRREAMDRGLICYPSGGTADGIAGDHVLLAPPYIIDESHVEEMIRILLETFDVVLSALDPLPATTS
jgi:adenosylmethionine-8-amino-7-oxononanoate aminotransferase